MAKKAAPQKPTPSIQDQILDIVAAGYDATKIAHALAKKHPLIFLELHHSVAPPIEKWMRDVISQLYAGNKIMSIKITRENTGIGLKEAKDVCDNLYNKMADMGYMIQASTPGNALNADLQALLNKLVDAARQCK